MIALNGVDASLEEIARRANVGVATLYRNFPTRDDLLRALYDLAIAELASVREEIVAAPTAWHGLVVYMECIAEWLVADPSLPPILKRMATVDPIHRPTAQFEGSIASLVAQAKRDGDLRADVGATDLAVLLTMVGSLGGLGEGYAGQWRRQLGIVLDGLRSPEKARAKLPGRPLAREANRSAGRSAAKGAPRRGAEGGSQ